MLRVTQPVHSTAGSRRVLAGLSLMVVLLIGTTILPWQRVAATTSAAAPVRVAKATVGNLQAPVSLGGELRATDQVEITPRTSARVLKLPATVGQAVKTGDVLAELDRTQLEIALTQAQATLTKERAALAKLRNGPRAEDLRREEANVAAAEAALAKVLQGPRAEDIDIATQKLNQARDNRAKTASTSSNTKEQARIAVEQAALSLQSAQAAYGASKLVYDEAVRTGRDPNVPSCPPTNRKCDDLTDIKLRQYKADFEAKQLAMQQAEQTLEARRLAYEDARKQEILSLQIAASQVQDAQANLDKARGGPEEEEIARARAYLEAARASLARVQSPALEQDIIAAQASVQSAEAAVRLAEMNLRDTQIVAPFDGIITQRYVSVGTLVSSSTALFQLVSARLEARLNAEDAQVAYLEPGQRAELRLSAYPSTTFTARVESISPAANLTSRTFTVILIPETTDARLKPGMLVQADVAAINKTNVLTIPEQAVVSRGIESLVFVVVDGKARRKVVQLGVRGNGVVEVVSGLTAGETVVIEGQTALNDNDPVTISG